jgi:hypothetical protein
VPPLGVLLPPPPPQATRTARAMAEVAKKNLFLMGIVRLRGWCRLPAC